MKKLLMAMAGLALLVGCSGLTTTAPTTTVNNTVSSAEIALTAAERLALIYTSLPRCGTAVATSLCSNTSTVAQIKSLDNQAYAVVKAAEQNEALVGAAIAAIQSLNSVIPAISGS